VVFRPAYDALHSRLGERASAEYVRILSLAANHGATTVEQVLGPLLDGGEQFDAEQVHSMIEPERPALPAVTITRPDLLQRVPQLPTGRAGTQHYGTVFTPLMTRGLETGFGTGFPFVKH